MKTLRSEIENLAESLGAYHPGSTVEAQTIARTLDDLLTRSSLGGVAAPGPRFLRLEKDGLVLHVALGHISRIDATMPSFNVGLYLTGDSDRPSIVLNEEQWAAFRPFVERHTVASLTTPPPQKAGTKFAEGGDFRTALDPRD